MSSFWSQLCSDCCKPKEKKTEESTQRSEQLIHNNPKDQNKVEDRNKNQLNNNNVSNQQNKRVIIDPNSDHMKIISINTYTEEEENKHSFIEQRLRKELTESIEGKENSFEDSYGKVMIPKKLFLSKEYNKFGLIDINSDQFSVIKKLMDRNYEIIDSIGSGNYAEVYRARSRQKDRKQKDVAIKVIDLIQIKRKYGISLISREVKIVRKLNHKNVIKVYEIIKSPNNICIAMQLTTNTSVAHFISKRGAFTEFVSWSIFVSVLEGLDHMHSKKMAHRNLKLENILLSENFDPKISDFCLAIIDKNNRPKDLYSLTYFAPEILQQLPHNPFISDIWSLGVCLYIMSNDCLPFQSEDEKEVLEKQLIGDWKFRSAIEPKLSKHLKEFIGIMLEPDITLRPTTKQLIKNQWIQNSPFH